MDSERYEMFSRDSEPIVSKALVLSTVGLFQGTNLYFFGPGAANGSCNNTTDFTERGKRGREAAQDAKGPELTGLYPVYKRATYAKDDRKS